MYVRVCVCIRVYFKVKQNRSSGDETASGRFSEWPLQCYLQGQTAEFERLKCKSGVASIV